MPPETTLENLTATNRNDDTAPGGSSWAEAGTLHAKLSSCVILTWLAGLAGLESEAGFLVGPCEKGRTFRNFSHS
jgi:hypothetical protein